MNANSRHVVQGLSSRRPQLVLVMSVRRARTIRKSTMQLILNANHVIQIVTVQWALLMMFLVIHILFE